MCARGLVDPEWKYPVRKKTKLVVTSKEIARKLALQCTCAQQGKQHRVIKGTWRVDGKRVPASNWCGGYCTGFAHNVLEAFGEQVKEDMLECYTAAEENLIDEDMRKIFEDDCPEEPLEKKRRKQQLLDDVPESIRKNFAKKRREKLKLLDDVPDSVRKNLAKQKRQKLQDDVPHSIRKNFEQKAQEAKKNSYLMMCRLEFDHGLRPHRRRSGSQ